MKKSILLIFGFILVIIVIAFYLFLNSTDNTDILINQGDYYDDNGKFLGNCTIERVKSSTGYLYIDNFYNINGKLIGSCLSTSSSGFSDAKGYCDDNAINNGITWKTDNSSIAYYTGSVIPKYPCTYPIP